MRRIVLTVALFLLVAAPAPADIPDKFGPRNVVTSKRLIVPPGELVRWRSPEIGTVTALSLAAGGWEMLYGVVPKTNACVGEAYAAGVAMRLTDCRNGRRVPYVRVRMVNSNIRPVTVVIRLHGRVD